jgi:hypothetical protein
VADRQQVADGTAVCDLSGESGYYDALGSSDRAGGVFHHATCSTTSSQNETITEPMKLWSKGATQGRVASRRLHWIRRRRLSRKETRANLNLR